MAKSRVYITVWKTWKGSRPIVRHRIRYAIMNSMDNLRFGKEDYFRILVFRLYAGYFIKEIENNFSRVPIRYRNIRGSLGELEIAWKHSWKFN